MRWPWSEAAGTAQPGRLARLEGIAAVFAPPSPELDGALYAASDDVAFYADRVAVADDVRHAFRRILLRMSAQRRENAGG